MHHLFCVNITDYMFSWNCWWYGISAIKKSWFKAKPNKTGVMILQRTVWLPYVAWGQGGGGICAFKRRDFPFLEPADGKRLCPTWNCWRESMANLLLPHLLLCVVSSVKENAPFVNTQKHSEVGESGLVGWGLLFVVFCKGWGKCPLPAISKNGWGHVF